MLLNKLVLFLSFAMIVAYKRYSPNWRSLDSRPLPHWYDKAKIGIFIQFSPSKIAGQSENVHDFAPQMTLDFFDPYWIADLVSSSGARYVGLTAKTQDGFANFNSTYAYGWNALDVGPKRNVIKELKDAFASRHPKIHFGVSYSLNESSPLWYKDKGNSFRTRKYSLNKMLPEMTELANLVKPDIWWSGGDMDAPSSYFGSRGFLAWLYNDSPSKDLIVTNDRWGIGTKQQHGGFISGTVNRHNFRIPTTGKRERCLFLRKQPSKQHNQRLTLDEVLSPEELIKEVSVSVSSGSNVLVILDMTMEGTIRPIFEERLRQLGSWLTINGQAIYGIQSWRHTKDFLSTNPEVWYTFRGSDVYAIMLGWPSGKEVLRLGAVRSTPRTRITMLGVGNTTLDQIQKRSRWLEIKLPPLQNVLKHCPTCQYASVFKMSNVKPILYMPLMFDLKDIAVHALDYF